MELTEDIQPYLHGDRLYGDDLSEEGIKAWYDDEKEGYASLDHDDAQSPMYVYYELNRQCGLRFLPNHRFVHALGIGSAYAEEFQPLLSKIDKITILEPSDKFVRDTMSGVPLHYVKPDWSGLMPFEAETFDLMTCLGVLHHIPNVSTIIGEMYRVARPGAYALVREPITSMGDWRKPRKGLTKHERGIPADLLEKMFAEVGFIIVKKSYVVFPLIPKLGHLLKLPAYNSMIMTRLDRLLSTLLSGNTAYHRASKLSKLGPNSCYYVLRKEESAKE